jgi:truncated hemoglobin YjbI
MGPAHRAITRSVTRPCDILSTSQREEVEEMSIYEEIGGGDAIEAALEVFYDKVMDDPRVSVFFDGLDVDRIKRKQKAFLSMALGGPKQYDGRTLRAAHHRAVEAGLDEPVYEVFMGHFQSTLEELEVPEGKIGEIMAIADTGRNDVLNR